VGGVRWEVWGGGGGGGRGAAKISGSIFRLKNKVIDTLLDA